MMQRQVLLVTHPTRKESQTAAAQLAQEVSSSIEFLSLSPDIPGYVRSRSRNFRAVSS